MSDRSAQGVVAISGDRYAHTICPWLVFLLFALLQGKILQCGAMHDFRICPVLTVVIYIIVRLFLCR
jgi:hypothetical protein